jgi:serine/threonine protein kinase
MEYCEHGSLHDVLVEQTSLAWPLVLSLLRQMALGVAALHALEPRLLHGDIRAESVRIGSEIDCNLKNGV